MSNYKQTSKIIDTVLQIIAGSAVISAGLSAPQLLEMLDTPTKKLFEGFEKREKRRKLLDTILYMRRTGMLIGDYEHGIRLTKKAERRLAKISMDELKVTTPKKWDGNWHLLFFDIPEQKRSNRNAFTQKLRELQFQALQKSIWVHPFQCKDEIALLSNYYGVKDYVSYVEVVSIDNEKALLDRFSHLLKF